MPQPRRQPERQAEPDRDALAVQQAAVVAVFRLQRVAERVAEIQQRAAVVRLFLALVVADHRGLERAGALDRLGLRLAVAADHRRRRVASHQAKNAASPISPALAISA